MWAMGDPRGPMEKGTTYIVRPFIEPRNSSVRVSFISAGARQLLVGPASISCSEQMKVRSSTRATSPGSERAMKLCGRLASLTGSKVPASTRSAHRRSYSSSEPSHHSTASGEQRSAISATQSSSAWFVVRSVCTSVTVPPSRCGGGYLPGRRGRSTRRREAGGAHVDLGTQTQCGGPPLLVQVEDDALALSDHPEHRAPQG